MGKASRTKGNAGELEVRRLYESHGFTVRGLEGAGDHLALGHGLTIFSEVKRAECWCVQEWLRQTWRECPEGALPVLAFRGNRWPWVAAVPLGNLLPFLGQPAQLAISEDKYETIRREREDFYRRLA